jgi:NAD(P)-dependent dehydrogenase (short-subunit alcohol dehydrogenase family)
VQAARPVEDCAVERTAGIGTADMPGTGRATGFSTVEPSRHPPPTGETLNTILITGCSSGFGLATAHYFLERGWQVIATMRRPDASVLPTSEHLRVLQLDVTDTASIQRLAETAGPIDVLVNNAGIGLMSVVEATPIETIRANFETNTFGAIAVTQAFLPHFRERRSG